MKNKKTMRSMVVVFYLQDVSLGINERSELLPPGTKSVKYNLISARLARMNVDFFEKAYQFVYEQ